MANSSNVNSISFNNYCFSHQLYLLYLMLTFSNQNFSEHRAVCVHPRAACTIFCLSMRFTFDASRIKKQDLNLSHKPSHNSQHCFQFCFVWVISVLDTLVCKNMQKWVCTSSKQYDQFKRDFNVEQAKRLIQNQRFREKSLNDLTILMNHRWLGLWLSRS